MHAKHRKSAGSSTPPRSCGSRAPRFNAARLSRSPISAVDLFCGAGGLTHGLLQAGICVAAGIDVDGQSEHAYTNNNGGAKFKDWDVSKTTAQRVRRLFAPSKYRLLAGCAPCQPFSKLTYGQMRHSDWGLLGHFAKLIRKTRPHLVTMENVPELKARGKAVFDRFVRTLEKAGYNVSSAVVNCASYGAPQMRKRLVLLASRLGPIAIPKGPFEHDKPQRTVRDAISDLPRVAAGKADSDDPIHLAAELSPTNRERIRATPRDGGMKDAWPQHLELRCHKKKTGARYRSIYGRMSWDDPAPTMTTLCNGIGNGRFGHPTQQRAITLREAAILQTFPRGYDFWPSGEKVNAKAVARMIGNAVPPILAKALGRALLRHVEKFEAQSSPKGQVTKRPR